MSSITNWTTVHVGGPREGKVCTIGLSQLCSKNYAAMPVNGLINLTLGGQTLINTTRALRTDQSKEEEFANIIEAYMGIYKY